MNRATSVWHLKGLWIEKMLGENTGLFVESEAPGSRQKISKHFDASFSYVPESFFTRLASESSYTYMSHVKGFLAPVPSQTTKRGDIIQNQKDIEDLVTIHEVFA